MKVQEFTRLLQQLNAQVDADVEVCIWDMHERTGEERYFPIEYVAIDYQDGKTIIAIQ